MLVLGRRTGEAILIGDNIRIVAIRCREGEVRLGIEAPQDVTIVREELIKFEKIEDEQMRQSTFETDYEAMTGDRAPL